MSDKEVKKAVFEAKAEYLEKLNNMRIDITNMFRKYHNLGVSMEKLLVNLDKMIDKYEKEFNGETQRSEVTKTKRTGHEGSDDKNLQDDSSGESTAGES